MFVGSMTSSHRRGAQPRTTTPLWQVTVDGNDDLHPAGCDERPDCGAPGREGEVGMRELLSILGNRLLHSRAYNLLYALLIVLNTAALVVAVSTPAAEPSPLVAALDAAITASLLVEVALRMLVQGRSRFWSDASNRFDCAVCALCIVTLFLTLLEPPSGTGRAEQVFTFAVVVVRYAIQLARLAVFVRSFKRTASGSTPDIDLGCSSDDSPLLDDDDAERQAGDISFSRFAYGGGGDGPCGHLAASTAAGLGAMHERSRLR
ncbi:hypothetical protein KFE25_014057 [Diacronema lutheri]|uniref:Ion transport domain-containing protein n=1 Tax=Diacronema lutheri TaxID=2081491 RepID=A0A7R9UN57_DIALT|nr:hypothetical protein KFE25_014057 [Diacronema lutheri]